ncbi:hypothetical protein COCCADRAFT_99388, partial [Bipolaris zeicola 26-R-13]
HLQLVEPRREVDLSRDYKISNEIVTGADSRPEAYYLPMLSTDGCISGGCDKVHHRYSGTACSIRSSCLNGPMTRMMGQDGIHKATTGLERPRMSRRCGPHQRTNLF